MIKYEHPLSWQALGRIFTAGLMIFLAWKMLSIFIAIFIAIILAATIHPLVKQVNKKLPLLLSILIVFLMFLIPFALFCIFLVPDLFRQLPELLSTLRPIINQFQFFPESLKSFDFAKYLSQHTADLFASAQTAFYIIIASIEILVLMFYFLLDHEQLTSLFIKLFPILEQKKFKKFFLIWLR